MAERRAAFTHIRELPASAYKGLVEHLQRVPTPKEIATLLLLVGSVGTAVKFSTLIATDDERSRSENISWVGSGNVNTEAVSNQSAEFQPYTPFGEIVYDEKLPPHQVLQNINSKLDDMAKSQNPLMREIASKYNELAHGEVPKFILVSDTANREPVDVMIAIGYENGKDIPIIGVSYRFLMDEAKFGQTISSEDWRILLYENMEIQNRVRMETSWQDMVKRNNELKQNDVILTEAWEKLGSEYGTNVNLPRLKQSWHAFSTPSTLLRN